MNLSKDQKVIIWITVGVVITLLGLETIYAGQRRDGLYETTQLGLYGNLILQRNIKFGIYSDADIKDLKWGGLLKPFHFMLLLGDHKYELIIAVIIISGTIILTQKRKS